MSTYYVVKNIKGPMPSKRTDGMYWEVILVNEKNGVEWKTYPDTTMKNFRSWNSIVAQSTAGWILSNLKPKILDKLIINADSPVEIIANIDRQTALNAVREQITKRPGNNFGNLFE
jgi:hypothetical protein